MTENGTFMPKEYTEWKEQVAEFLGYSLQYVHGYIHLDLTFTPFGVALSIQPTEDERFGRADLDNLVGGVMDALQDSGVIDNDSQVVSIEAGFSTERIT